MIKMMNRCVKCGKKGFKRFCPECFLEQHAPVKAMKNSNVKICARCFSIFSRNRWASKKNTEDALLHFVKENIVFSNEVKRGEIVIDKIKIVPEIPDLVPGPGNNIDVGVEIRFKLSCPEYSLKGIDDKYEFAVKVLFTLCPKCSKDSNQYFEAILQVRNAPEDVLEFIEKNIDKRSSEGVFISKMVNHRNGVDIYLTSAKYCRTLADKLHKRFGCTVKRSAKLYTHDRSTGRRVYRPSLLLRFPDIAPKSVVQFGNKVILVSSITESRVNGTDLMSRKKVSLRYREKLVKLRVYETSVSKVYPKLEVLHPETFQSVGVENPVQKLNLGDTVKVVIVDKKIYLC